MSENEYPFDRDNVQVDVSFPVAAISRKDDLFGKVRELATRFGGRESGNSEPMPEFMGKPGFDTFGMAVAFEAGDVNIETFIDRVENFLGHEGATVQFDPENVLSAAEDDDGPGFRR